MYLCPKQKLTTGLYLPRPQYSCMLKMYLAVADSPARCCSQLKRSLSDQHQPRSSPGKPHALLLLTFLPGGLLTSWGLHPTYKKSRPRN